MKHFRANYKSPEYAGVHSLMPDPKLEEMLVSLNKKKVSDSTFFQVSNDEL